jgi:hypothetical protein
MRALGSVPDRRSTPDEFLKFVRGESDKLGKVIRDNAVAVEAFSRASLVAPAPQRARLTAGLSSTTGALTASSLPTARVPATPPPPTTVSGQGAPRRVTVPPRRHPSSTESP